MDLEPEQIKEIKTTGEINENDDGGIPETLGQGKEENQRKETLREITDELDFQDENNSSEEEVEEMEKQVSSFKYGQKQFSGISI